jgi:hypothetical protein
VLALGADQYQLATTAQEFQAAIPRLLLGNQLINGQAGFTTVAKTKSGGFMMETKIIAKNSASA